MKNLNAVPVEVKFLKNEAIKLKLYLTGKKLVLHQHEKFEDDNCSRLEVRQLSSTKLL